MNKPLTFKTVTRTESISPLGERWLRENLDLYQCSKQPLPISREDPTSPVPAMRVRADACFPSSEMVPDVSFLQVLEQARQEEYRVKSCALATVIRTIQLHAKGDETRPVLPRRLGLKHEKPECKLNMNYPVADFYKAADHGWTEMEYEVEKAVKEYLEGGHADR